MGRKKLKRFTLNNEEWIKIKQDVKNKEITLKNKKGEIFIVHIDDLIESGYNIDEIVDEDVKRDRILTKKLK